MNTYHRLFTALEHVPPSSFFAGGNSAAGYRAIPDTLLEEEKLDKLYILKGGPGTGKSTFMRTIAKCAEEHGLAVTYYYCASDPNSLDGIVICQGEKKLGVVDGTPPHIKEAMLPGVSGEYVNLGAFWDSSGLEEKRETITALAHKKAEFFSMAARYLAAAEILDVAAEKCIRHAVLETKMKQAVHRLLLHFPDKKEKRTPETVLLHAHTMKGSFYLAAPTASTKYHCSVLESSDTSRFYLREIGAALADRGHRVQLAVSPIRHDLPLAILLPEHSLSFTVSEEKSEGADLTVNMARFLDKNILFERRAEYRSAASKRKEMIRCAEETLQRAAEVHFALEALYVPEMDFEKMRNLIESINAEILHRFTA